LGPKEGKWAAELVLIMGIGQLGGLSKECPEISPITHCHWLDWQMSWTVN